jgi:hypothetical protein
MEENAAKIESEEARENGDPRSRLLMERRKQP